MGQSEGRYRGKKEAAKDYKGKCNSAGGVAKEEHGQSRGSGTGYSLVKIFCLFVCNRDELGEYETAFVPAETADAAEVARWRKG